MSIDFTTKDEKCTFHWTLSCQWSHLVLILPGNQCKMQTTGCNLQDLVSACNNCKRYGFIRKCFQTILQMVCGTWSFWFAGFVDFLELHWKAPQTWFSLVRHRWMATRFPIAMNCLYYLGMLLSIGCYSWNFIFQCHCMVVTNFVLWNCIT